MTSDPFVPLSELERDALRELSNIAMAKAASSLRQMIQNEVLLAVPSVDILTGAAATQLVAKPTIPGWLRCGRTSLACSPDGRSLSFQSEAALSWYGRWSVDSFLWKTSLTWKMKHWLKPAISCSTAG